MISQNFTNIFLPSWLFIFSNVSLGVSQHSPLSTMTQIIRGCVKSDDPFSAIIGA